ncbi:RDD family protein [Myroides injenensis]|uniref:RDD family protein n=1 Tax=Myroides injenensis TaxID=1183151 RepID=UPI000287FFCD|nr:RDD family protein [Myroides injenensis]
MANLTINTTQNINIDFKNASIGERILAFLLDSVFKILYLIAIFYVLVKSKIIEGFSDDWSRGAFILIVCLPVILYTLFFEVILQGATPGKRIMKIRVIKIDGYQATIADYFIRWIMRLVDIYIVSAFIGVIAIVSSKKNQRLGDMLAGTAVISTKERIGLSATIFQEVESEYVPVFPQVLTLTDNDIRIVKETLLNYKTNRDARLLERLCDKLISVLGVNKRDLSNQEFIELVLKDYNYLASRV